MSESAYEQVIAEYDALEQEADAFLQEADPEGKDRGLALTRTLRKAMKRSRQQIEAIRSEARTEARLELIRERQTEAGFRRLAVPPSARALFSDVDPTDQAAMQARADELREAGVTWPGQPQPPVPPPPDPNLAAMIAMQAAAAGGETPGSEGDLADRLRKQAANPGAYSDRERDRTVDDYNRAVDAAARKGGAGALG